MLRFIGMFAYLLLVTSFASGQVFSRFDAGFGVHYLPTGNGLPVWELRPYFAWSVRTAGDYSPICGIEVTGAGSFIPASPAPGYTVDYWLHPELDIFLGVVGSRSEILESRLYLQLGGDSYLESGSWVLPTYNFDRKATVWAASPLFRVKSLIAFYPGRMVALVDLKPLSVQMEGSVAIGDLDTILSSGRMGANMIWSFTEKN